MTNITYHDAETQTVSTQTVSTQTVSNTEKKLTAGHVLGHAALSVPVGALVYPLFGSLGKFALSFFDSSMASCAGSFGTFAAMGAIAAPLVIIPSIIKDHFLDHSEFLKNYPNLKGFLNATSSFLINLGAITAAAAMLSIPVFGATVISMLIIPAVCNALMALYHTIQGALDYCQKEERPAFAPT